MRVADSEASSAQRPACARRAWRVHLRCRCWRDDPRCRRWCPVLGRARAHLRSRGGRHRARSDRDTSRAVHKRRDAREDSRHGSPPMHRAARRRVLGRHGHPLTRQDVRPGRSGGPHDPRMAVPARPARRNAGRHTYQVRSPVHPALSERRAPWRYGVQCGPVDISQPLGFRERCRCSIQCCSCSTGNADVGPDEA